MKKLITKGRLLAALVFVILLLVAHYAGGAIGYHQGYQAGRYLRDSDAYATSLALAKLRDKDYASVTDLLETRLDTEVIQWDASKNAYKSPYNVFWFVLGQSPKEAAAFLMSSVAEYRGRYPSPNQLPDVRQKIADILSRAAEGIPQ
ncbi:hypothetical protein ACFL2Q_12230 [Thermodesulfobacteriota bacterium]